MLEIRDLRVSIEGREIIHIDHLDLQSGSRLGLVGESGSGKTMTVKAIAGLLPDDTKISGSIKFDGRDLLTLSDREFANVRGNKIGFVFQDPARSLNPMMRIGKQVSEAIRIHTDLKGSAVTEKVIDLLGQVQLPDPASLLRRYPHQLSGGQQQRVMIAAAIAADPDLLIADEPTTALDVTVQEEILHDFAEREAQDELAFCESRPWSSSVCL
jgi:peptide/nickel transport system ATP-binding protein